MDKEYLKQQISKASTQAQNDQISLGQKEQKIDLLTKEKTQTLDLLTAVQ